MNEKVQNGNLKILLLLALFASSLFAAGINPFEYAKDAFFEIATSYVFLIIVAVILVATFVAIAKTGEWSILWWAGAGIIGIALIPTFAPGVMEWAQSFDPTPVAGP